jgi:hypothetical protein
LLEALKWRNPEVRKRAGENPELGSLGRERAFAMQGKYDRFVAAAAASDNTADDDRLWQAVFDVGPRQTWKTKVPCAFSAGAR